MGDTSSKLPQQIAATPGCSRPTKSFTEYPLGKDCVFLWFRLYSCLFLTLWIETLRELRYTWEQISSALMVSRTTIWRHFQQLGLQMSSYTQITDSDLDCVMATLVRRFPNNGTSMMWGHLRSVGIVVTRARVQESLLRVSESSVRSRQRLTVQRRV